MEPNEIVLTLQTGTYVPQSTLLLHYYMHVITSVLECPQVTKITRIIVQMEPNEIVPTWQTGSFVSQNTLLLQYYVYTEMSSSYKIAIIILVGFDVADVNGMRDNIALISLISILCVRLFKI